ncbi:MAG: zincin-like metallopeptidase domain-containing protein [Bacteroidota bacterium]
MTSTPKPDVYSTITDSIIEAIEAGQGTSTLPWHRAGDPLSRPRNVLTGNAYNGINILALWVSAMKRHFTAGTWGTYRQWQEAGAQVRKGEKSTVVVFYKELPPKDDGEDEDEGPRRVARSFRVFNADQVDGYTPPELPAVSEVERNTQADAFVRATGADIRHGGGRAFYRQTTDHIQMPDLVRFTATATSTTTEGYYTTLFHELTHWSGHPARCARDLTGRFGDDAYAMEELIAELGAAFLAADLRVSPQPRLDHAGYIAHWLRVLKADSRAVFTAAAKASEAATYLSQLQTA